jgi:PTS system mannose-specific IID component
VASEHRRIRTIDLLGVFWRSFFIQASWSFDRLQSLGFAFAMIPVLRRLYPDGDACSARLKAHLEYFNTQPYLASFVLGAVARAEEEQAAGGASSTDPGEIKRTLMAPLGALGDSFFWGALKPFAAAVAVAMLLGGVWWAPLLYLGLYNTVHVGLRAALVFEGYRTGGDVVALLSRYHFTRMSRLFKVLSLAGIGCIVGTAAAWGPELRVVEPVSDLFLATAGMAAVLGMIALLRVKVSPVQLMLGLAALCLGLAFGGLI